MNYYGYTSGYGMNPYAVAGTGACCGGFAPYNTGYGHGYGYGAGMILVLFILLVIIFGVGFGHNDGCGCNNDRCNDRC